MSAREEPGADPRLVGPYRIGEAIGAGGTARVDLARIDRAYGFRRTVVLKRPLEHLRHQPAASASLQREARLGGLLRHPNLIGVLDAGEHDGYAYIVLEYVEGASLREVVASDLAGRVRDVPLAFALGVIHDAARGLHHAHEVSDERGDSLGLVHRDVTPANILLGIDGAVKVADFGIAKETHVHTLSGSLQGTASYMAPEMARGHAFDRRADVFSLGVILYELVTGVRPFHADNDVAAMHRVLAGEVERPRAVMGTRPITDRLEEAIMTALATDPAARFGTARAFADEVAGIAGEARVSLVARRIAEVVAATQATGRTPADRVPAPGVRVPRTAFDDEAPTAVGHILARDGDDASRRELEPDGSLVALLEALSDEPPEPPYGVAVADATSGPAPAPGLDPSPAPAPPARSGPSARVALALGTLAIAAGVGIAIFFLARGHAMPLASVTPDAGWPRPDAAVTLPLAAPTDAVPPSPPPAPPPPPIDAVEPDEPVTRDRVAPDASATTRPRGRARPVPAPDAALAPEVRPPDAGLPVQWDPTMLLPTDP